MKTLEDLIRIRNGNKHNIVISQSAGAAPTAASRYRSAARQGMFRSDNAALPVVQVDYASRLI